MLKKENKFFIGKNGLVKIMKIKQG